MELSKPQVFNPGLNELIESVQQEMLQKGLLDEYLTEHYAKITKDYIKIYYVTHHILPQQENNVVLDEFKSNVVAGYFTLLELSHYQIDVEDYLNTLLNTFEESMAAKLFKSNDLLGDIIPNDLIIEIMSGEMMEFLIKYGQERWPAIVDEINNLSPEELQRRLHGANKQNL